MKCLVVTTHPLTGSLCKQLTKHTIVRLKESGHEVTIEDLYSNGFEPVLTAVERESYYDGVYDSSSIAEETGRLLETEALILLFPTWWFGFPAMLKGWFDRVWGPGIAYDHASNSGVIKPRLAKLKKVIVITTVGSPWWVDKLVMRQPVKRVVKTALLGACAKQSSLQFLSLYNSEKLEEKKVSAFKRSIDRALANWDTR